MALNLIWFRNDLRVTDNPALWHGSEAGACAGIFYLTPGQWQSHHMAGCRVQFILEGLRILQQQLAELGIPLVVREVDRFADISADLTRFCKEHQVASVFWNDEYPVDEARRDRVIAKGLEVEGVAVRRFHDRVIAAPGTVVKDNADPYKVFTPYKKTWLHLLDQGLPEPFPRPGKQRPVTLESTKIPEALEPFTSHLKDEAWPAGEQEATHRLEKFIDTALEHYHRDRDYPAVEGTSSLSPYLAVGNISPQQCLLAALSGSRGEGADTWISELVWRDFYQHIMVFYPRVCMNKPFKPETEGIPWRSDDKDLRAWCEGRTGVPLVDAGMRQLRATGWMHNRVRMVAAMFLSKNLLLDWRLGERFFMENLIDGDFAANNGGWQWSASTGTDAVPYFRIFNPFSQAQRFDPKALYIKRHVPELDQLDARDINDPQRLARVKPDSYPAPIVDLAQSRQAALAAFKSL